jgi:hypothetical protein
MIMQESEKTGKSFLRFFSPLVGEGKYALKLGTVCAKNNSQQSLHASFLRRLYILKRYEIMPP